MSVAPQHITFHVPVGGDFVTCRFDYPQTTGQPFLFSIPMSFSGNEWAVLRQVLNGREGKAKLVRMVEEDLAAFKVYDISQYVPAMVGERLGTQDDVPGPNCFQAALAALGIGDVAGRYVDPVEAAFFFFRYFEKVDGEAGLGDIKLYYRKHMVPSAVIGLAAAEPSLIEVMSTDSDMDFAVGASKKHIFHIDEPSELGQQLGLVAAEVEPSRIIKPGVHAALVLLGGLVFQKDGWDDDHTYKVVPAAQAMSSIEVITRDPLYPGEQADDDDYVSRAYRLLAPDTQRERDETRRIDAELTERIAECQPVIEYYTARLAAVAGFQWGEFAQNRVDLLTMENLWEVLSEIENILHAGDEAFARSLLSVRDNIARAFLKLRSFKWQYQAMVQRYDSPGRTDSRRKKLERRATLYREHYIDPDSEAFAKEINAYLRMRRIASRRFPAVRAYVIDKVKEQATEEYLLGYAESNGSKGIKFIEILNEAIDRLSSRGGR